jgi:phage shock protein PspC (stress-responsive transcriptional regulator)
MSATMSISDSPLCRPKVISGVCAEIAGRAGVPVWLPRLAFVLFGIMHWLLAIILYFVLAKFICPGQRSRMTASFTPPPPPSYGFATVRDKFSALDARLANLEAATVQSEAELRRAFRDLDRR